MGEAGEGLSIQWLQAQPGRVLEMLKAGVGHLPALGIAEATGNR